MARARLAKRYRIACAWETRIAKPPKLHGPLTVHITFHAPDNRVRDIDNMVSAIKSGCDGIADVIGVDDSEWSLIITRGEVKKGGAVIVKLEAA